VIPYTPPKLRRNSWVPFLRPVLNEGGRGTFMGGGQSFRLKKVRVSIGAVATALFEVFSRGPGLLL